MNVILPPALRPDDTIGIISPSWFGGETFIRRASRGIRMLESLGYHVSVADHAFENAGHVSASALTRANDLHAMFANPDVRMILCTIGGTHASEILPLLDFGLIASNPKILMGFSDITVLHNAIHSETNLVTFYGPGLLTDWAEYPTMPPFSLDAALKAITRTDAVGPLDTAGEWTDEFLDWEAGEDETRLRVHTPSTGWNWINEGTASGRLFGGCLESLQHLRGTRWWPDFDDAILFFETSEDCPSPIAFDEMFLDYANMGILDRVNGLLVSRPYGFDASQHDHFIDLLTRRVAPYDIPVVANMDFGHTSPQHTIPIGVGATINSSSRQVTIDEPAVR